MSLLLLRASASLSHAMATPGSLAAPSLPQCGLLVHHRSAGDHGHERTRHDQRERDMHDEEQTIAAMQRKCTRRAV